MSLPQKIIFPVLLCLLTSCFYFYVNNAIAPFSNWPELKYSANDSSTYLAVGNWLLKKESFSDAWESIVIRPFFYPLIVAGLETVHPWAIIAFQYLLWQAQIILVFYCGLIISKSAGLSFLLAICSASLLSPIGISLHVLTETTVSFFLTLSILLLLVYTKNKKPDRLLFFYLLLLSLCAVTKPSYLYIFIINIIFCTLLWKKKRLAGFLIASLLCVPIVFQYSIMRQHFNLNKLSFIDTLAINDYFLSALELYKRNLEYHPDGKKMMVVTRDLRRKALTKIIEKDPVNGYNEAAQRVTMDLFRNLEQFPIQSFRLFTDYVLSNARQRSFYVMSKKQNNLFLPISFWQSTFFWYLNICSLFLFILSLIFSRVKKKMSTQLPDNYLLVNCMISTTILFTYISSGVSGFQGDRFLIPIFFISLIWFFYQINAAITLYRPIIDK